MQSGSGHGRGRHKGAGSPETRKWLEVAETVDRWTPEPKRKRAKPKLEPAPPQPAWMDDGTRAALLELRKELA